MEGVVKMWGDKGYGFIAAEGCDYFVHFKDVISTRSGVMDTSSDGQHEQHDFVKLFKGQKVSFEPGVGKKGPIGTKVRVI